MSDVQIDRSIQFVSLDTHPANNALVVTYEVTVSISNRSSQVEFIRRNKRDQLQINISILDNLTRDDLKADKLVINLKELSEDIVSKCPMLVCERNNFEDIQLHLLYLINRRQSQLLAQNDDLGISHSSASASASPRPQRLRSAKSAHQMRLSAGHLRQASSAATDSISNSTDVYNYLLVRESTKEFSTNHDELLEYFMVSFDEHLIDLECRQSENGRVRVVDASEDLEVYLEGLYGDKMEKLDSIASLRHLSKINLSRMSSNRLLICAMLRNLRDSDAQLDIDLRQSIMFSLIRFTTYKDICERFFGDDDQSVNLLKLISDLLYDQVRVLVNIEAASSDSSKLLSMNDNSYFYTTSLIMTIVNLFKMDSCHDYQMLKTLLISQNQHNQDKTPGESVSLFELLQLVSRQLAKELHLTTKKTSLLYTQRSIDLLNGLINILAQLSIFKEFIQQLRASSVQQQLLVAESLIELMSLLQLARPGSGKPSTISAQQRSATNSLPKVNDRQTLNEFYELEMKLMRLVCNLLLDSRIRLKLIRKNLLKCVLRNLVVFLAIRKSTSLSPFDQSSVLIEPFKCLYELSRNSEVRLELFKSKIIIKCLLEYLLNSTMDLSALLDKQIRNLSMPTTSTATRETGQEDTVQIVVEAKTAHHFIIALWVNLSSKPVPFVHGNDAQLNQLVSEYIENCLTILQNFTISVEKNWPPSLNWTDEGLMMVYLHSKLLRNMSQCYGRDSCTKAADWPIGDRFANWSESIARSVCKLIAFEQTQAIFTTITVECLTTLSNFISIGKKLESNDLAGSKLKRWPSDDLMASLLEKLFSLNLNNFEPTENDDLILASIVLLGSVARHCEICQLIELEPNISGKVLNASNIIFEMRMTDEEMVEQGLLTLSQLTNHAGFLRELAESCTRAESPIGERSLGQLVDKLAHLMLNGNQSQVAQLASNLLVCFEQLDGFSGAELNTADEDELEPIGRLVRAGRFASYNSKWLAAIRASRDEFEISSGASSNAQRHDLETLADHDDDDDDDGFDLLARRAHSAQSQTRSQAASFTGETRLFGAEELSDGSERSALATTRPDRSSAASRSSCELDSDEETNGEQNYDDDDENGPDFNVVDANSMIKHLISRREFRSKWLQH